MLAAVIGPPAEDESVIAVPECRGGPKHSGGKRILVKPRPS